MLQWHVKSTTKAQQGLYEYDAVARLRDSQLGDERVHDISNYIVKGPLWEAFELDKQAVLLIDEIDKADIEFPNDLLRELDRMEFYVYETHETIVAKHRPIIVITGKRLGRHILDQQQLQPVQQFGGRRLFLQARNLAQIVKRFERFAQQFFFQARVMHLNDRTGLRPLPGRPGPGNRIPRRRSELPVS